MPGILIIAHTPLASALKAVALHTFPERAQFLEAYDVKPDMSQEDIEAHIRQLLHRVRNPDALVLTDVFGATPCNVAQRLVQTSEEGHQVKIIAGVNVPMLWRSLCYEDRSLDAMVARAMSGATQGVMTAGISKPQNQAPQGVSHDQSNTYHQQ